MTCVPGESTFAGLGGPYVDAVPVENPSTDVGSATYNELIGTVAGMSHTAWRAWVRILGHATTPTVVTTTGHKAVWGASSGVKPTLVRNGTGDITITWPASVTAEDGTSQVPAFNVGTYTITGTQFGTATLTFSGNNTCRIRLTKLTVASPCVSSADDFVGIEIQVFVA